MGACWWTRESTKEWWITQLGSRIEEHTGLFVIGSRQHPDDLHSVLINDPSWDVIVEQAHDPLCDLSEEEEHWDCLLAPEFRSYKWLMSQKREADKVSPGLFRHVVSEHCADGWVAGVPGGVGEGVSGADPCIWGVLPKQYEAGWSRGLRPGHFWVPGVGAVGV